MFPMMALVTGAHAEGWSSVGGTPLIKKVSLGFIPESGRAPFPAILVEPAESRVLLQNDLCWTAGLHRGIHRGLSAGQTALEVLARIQTVCFVCFLASGLKELWGMGR